MILPRPRQKGRVGRVTAAIAAIMSHAKSRESIPRSTETVNGRILVRDAMELAPLPPPPGLDGLGAAGHGLRSSACGGLRFTRGYSLSPLRGFEPFDLFSVFLRSALSSSAFAFDLGVRRRKGVAMRSDAEGVRRFLTGAFLITASRWACTRRRAGRCSPRRGGRGGCWRVARWRGPTSRRRGR